MKTLDILNLYYNIQCDSRTGENASATNRLRRHRLAAGRAMPGKPRRHGQSRTAETLDRLGHAIVAGHYGGTRFPTETQLAKRCGVSRTVVREALKMLSAKGLLQSKRRLGTVVQPLEGWNFLDPDVLRWLLSKTVSLDLFRHLQSLHVPVAATAAALAATALPNRGHGSIEEAFERIQNSSRHDPEMLEAQIAFQIAVLEASANRFFAQLRHTIAAAVHLSLHLRVQPRRATETEAAYSAVRAAIAARNPRRAEEAMLALVGSRRAEGASLVPVGATPRVALEEVWPLPSSDDA